MLAATVDPLLVPVIVNEGAYVLCRRSTSAIAKYALVLRKISFAWRNSRFSRLRAFIFSAISLETPAHWPLATADLLTQLSKVCGAQPIFGEIDRTACQRDPC